MARPRKYSPKLRERAVRMVFDHAHTHPSQWATIRSVAEKIGTLLRQPIGNLVVYANHRANEDLVLDRLQPREESRWSLRQRCLETSRHNSITKLF